MYFFYTKNVQKTDVKTVLFLNHKSTKNVQKNGLEKCQFFTPQKRTQNVQKTEKKKVRFHNVFKNEKTHKKN